MNWLSETTLTGTHATLEPLRREHLPGLQAAVADGELWRLWYAILPTPDTMPAYVDTALAAAERGDLAFAVRENVSGRIVGSTRFYNVDAANRRAMLGYTWYARSVQGTAINPECKYLMLRHFFEQHDGLAIEFRTHFHNHTSRRAIEKLGARQDGILRCHQIMPDGSLRDTVVYSILNSEWPAVRHGLQHRLATAY